MLCIKKCLPSTSSTTKKRREKRVPVHPEGVYTLHRVSIPASAQQNGVGSSSTAAT